MERVGVLINKLQEQLQQKANVQNMLVTAQLLQKELLTIASESNGVNSSGVTVMVPNPVGASAVDEDKYKPAPTKPEPEPEPVLAPPREPELPIPEQPPVPTPKPEPEPIPHFVEQNPWQQVFPQ